MFLYLLLVYIFILYLFSVVVVFFFFKQKTAYEMRISDWSSDVCSSDLARFHRRRPGDRPAGRSLQARGPGRTRLLSGLSAQSAEAEIGRASCRERVCQYV